MDLNDIVSLKTKFDEQFPKPVPAGILCHPNTRTALLQLCISEWAVGEAEKPSVAKLLGMEIVTLSMCPPDTIYIMTKEAIDDIKYNEQQATRRGVLPS